MQVSTDCPRGICIAQNDGQDLVGTGGVGRWSEGSQAQAIGL